MIKENILTELFYFDKNGEKTLFRNCKLLNNFYFSRNDFYLVEFMDRYNVCIEDDGNLITIWATDRNGVTPQEAMSLFRKGYIDNGITREKIEKFLKSPKKHKKKSRST